MPTRNLWEQISAPSKSYFKKLLSADYMPRLLNNEPLSAINAAGDNIQELLRYGASNDVRVGGAKYNAALQTYTFAIAANGALADQPFFTAPYAMRIKQIVEVHSAAGNDSGAVTLTLKKASNGYALADSTATHTALSMKTTANTPQTATLSSTPGITTLALGDRLYADFSGTLTTLAGVVVTITFTNGGDGDLAVWSMNANGSLADQYFYIANRRRKISAIYYSHETKGTNGSAVNLQVTKDTSTNAPGAGTDLLTNNTNAGFNCKGANATLQTGALSATVSDLWLNAGDRLSVDFAGTLTTLAGVVVVVVFEPLYTGVFDITWSMAANGSLADQAFFIAPFACEILDARYINATAGNDGSAVNMQITADRLTDAPGAGTNLLTNNTNAGFNCKTTAATIEVGALDVLGVRFLNAGDRLSVDFAGTLTTLAGVCTTITLRAA